MTPEEIRGKIHNAYKQAIANPSVFRNHSSNLSDLLRDLKLYGEDAGTDFVETHIGRIVKEAVDEAECKKPALEISFYGCGRGAIDGMATALRVATEMNVDVNGASIKLVWADINPRLL